MAGWRELKHLPLALGLRAAWSVPLVAKDGRILGTFGTYFRTARETCIVETASRDSAVATPA